MKPGLTDQQVQQYQQDGYIIIENLLPPAMMVTADQVINAILAANKIADIAELEPQNNDVIRRIWQPTQRHEFFKTLAQHPLLLDVIEKLIGKNILYHYSKLNMKGPQVGSAVAWHQDFSYYPHTNTDLVSCLVYLDDATVENGCLQVIPGSHRRGLLDHYIDGYFRGKVAADVIATLPEKPVYLAAPAGSVIFLHCMTLHASATNQSDKPRRAFIPAYRAADAYPIYFGPHASHNEPHVELLRGQISHTARQESMQTLLPLAERKFNSLYDLQEGTHIANKAGAIKGYYVQS